MKKILFLLTHLGSDFEPLFKVLDENARIQGHISGLTYDHMDVCEAFTDKRHKLPTSAAIYMDVLVHNHSLSRVYIFDFCKFIFLIREARPTIYKLINLGFTPKNAVNYYTYRLRRLYETAKKHPDAMFLTHEDLENQLILDQMKDYLNLKDELNVPAIEKQEFPVIDETLINKAQDRYEWYLSQFKKLKFYPSTVSGGVSSS